MSDEIKNTNSRVDRSAIGKYHVFWRGQLVCVNGLTPAQYVAGLTDFGPGRSKLFGNSADEYLKVHQRSHSEADVTAREASGNVCTTIGPIPTASS